MDPTYRAVAEFAQTWGLVYFVADVCARARLRAVAIAQEGSSRRRRAFRCRRTRPWPTPSEIDALTGTATTGHEWDGMQRIEYAAAALVAVAVLRHHRLGGRLLYRLSGLAAGLSSTQGVLGWHSRTAVVEDLAALQAQRGADDGQACRRFRRSRSRPIRSSPTLHVRVGRVAFADNCAPCHGAGGGGSQGISQPQRRRLAVGRQARRHRADHSLWRALWRRQCPAGQHARVRPRRHAQV